MPTANILTINPAMSWSSVQPALIAAGIFCMLALSLGSVALLVVLRYRVLRIVSQASSREPAISNLAAELEAQALLAKQMSADLEELRKRVLSYEEVNQPSAVSWPNLSRPMNLNRRGQILRLSRKGKSIAEIASDLHLAQGEVELLLKVHDLSPKNPGSEN